MIICKELFVDMRFTTICTLVWFVELKSENNKNKNLPASKCLCGKGVSNQQNILIEANVYFLINNNLLMRIKFSFYLNILYRSVTCN